MTTQELIELYHLQLSLGLLEGAKDTYELYLKTFWSN